MPINGGPAVKLNDPLTSGGDVLSHQISPDGERVVYDADQEADSLVELFATFDDSLLATPSPTSSPTPPPTATAPPTTPSPTATTPTATTPPPAATPRVYVPATLK